MSVSLDYVKFVLPIRIGIYDFSTIDISPDGADCKKVGSVELLDSGWVKVYLHADAHYHYVSGHSVRYAREPMLFPYTIVRDALHFVSGGTATYPDGLDPSKHLSKEEIEARTGCYVSDVNEVAGTVTLTSTPPAPKRKKK